MFSAPITALLQEKLELPHLLMAPSLRHDYDEVLAAILPPGSALALVDDNDTASALGDTLHRALKSRYAVTRISCGKAPTASQELVEALRRQTKNANALVAVGSGTVSDLCKYASSLDAKPYVVFPTAASMNGYTSANASITVKGFKTTLPAQLPKAIICDTSVIASAPTRLNKSGLGDSLARSTAQTDWLLSHYLLGTPYDETPFTLLKETEPALLDSARGIALADPATLGLLMQTLLLSGFGMTIAGGSYPASQSEHMLAHTYEMLFPHAPATLHGEQIGVTTLAAATRQHDMLTRTPTLQSLNFPKFDMQALFTPPVVKSSEEAFHMKRERIEKAHLDNSTLTSRWPEIAHNLEKVMLPPARIMAILTEAQAPRHPETLGWSTTDYASANQHARFTRDRFTCLDIQ
ncbi:MAG: iron-containing alcohol dehydrogenase [Rickettsiales bacterium]|nr:iron-containing alcohol dehydrogenase [Rickettsiales bacterium]